MLNPWAVINGGVMHEGFGDEAYDMPPLTTVQNSGIQQARPGDRTGVDGVAHVLVNRRAEALNRRESGLDRGLEIARLI